MRYRDIMPALEFEALVRGIIDGLNLGHVASDDRLRARDIDFDIEFTNNAGMHVVECKAPGPQTRQRVRIVIEQLLATGKQVEEIIGYLPQMILAIPGELAPEAHEQFRLSGIKVWDRAWV